MYEDKVAKDRFYDFVPLAILDLLTVFQAQIGSEAFLIEVLAYIEGFSGTGMTYMHGVPAHLAVGDVVIGTEVGVEGLVVGVEG